MPEIKFKEIRLPELHLPEMSRDDIIKSLGDVRDDLVDMRRDIDLSKVEMPKVDLTKVDVPKAVASAAQAAGLTKRRSSRMPFVIGALVTIGVVGWALLNSQALKPRLRAAVDRAKEMIDERRAANEDREAHAFDEAVAVPVEPSAYADALDGPYSPFADAPSDLPQGMGSDGAIGAPDGVPQDATARA